jgi:hypothetical protein
MDLSRLTARQQVKYLEEEAKREEERHLQQEEEEEALEREPIIGSWTTAIVVSTSVILPRSEIQVKVTCCQEENDSNDSRNNSARSAHTTTAMGNGKRKEDDDIQTRLKRLGKKIRIQDDDDDNDMDVMQDDEETDKDVGAKKEESSSPVEANDKSSDDYARNKLLNRAKKTQEQKDLQKKLRAKEPSNEKDGISSSKKASITAIPKKASTGIPRKSGDALPKEPVSLLANIKPAPSSGAAAAVGTSRAGTKLPKKPSTDGKTLIPQEERDTAVANSGTTTPMPRSSPMPLETDVSAGSKKAARPPPSQAPVNMPQQRPAKSQASPLPLTPPPQVQQQQQQQQPLLFGGTTKRSNNTMALRIMDSLAEACTKLAEEENSKFRLHQSSSPNSNRHHQNFAIDLWASLLSRQQYDFFDTDAKGKNVLQEKIPIFPEDFSVGTPAWPLSWWGIVDPALTEERPEIPSSAAAADTTNLARRTIDSNVRPTNRTNESRDDPRASSSGNAIPDVHDEMNPPNRNRNRHRGPPPPQGSRGAGGGGPLDYYGSGAAPQTGSGGGDNPGRGGGSDEYRPRGPREGPNAAGRGGPPHSDFRGGGGRGGGGNRQGGGGRGGGPPFDQRGPPQHSNGGGGEPPFDHRGPLQGSSDYRGPPPSDRGRPNRGPLVQDNRGPPPGHSGHREGVGGGPPHPDRGGPSNRQPRGVSSSDRQQPRGSGRRERQRSRSQD